MMNRKSAFSSAGLLLAAGAMLTAGLTGCGEEEKPVVQAAPPPAPPPPPPPPKAISTTDLIAELNVDPRIKMSEAAAPRSTEDRRAVLTFFDAIVKNNVNSVESMLAPREQAELANLRETGRWDSAVEGVTEIAIETGPKPSIIGVGSPSARLAVLAIFEVNGHYEPTLWYLSSGPNGAEFEAAPTPPDILNRVSGTDMIAAWHRIIQEEMDRSQEMDVVVKAAQQILDQRDATQGGQPGQEQPPGSPPPGLPAPGGPGGPTGPGPSIPID